MRDIHVGKRGSEAASEEQPDKLRKTARFEQDASSAASSSDPAVPLEYLASGETQDRLGPHLCRSHVMLMTTYKFPRWMHTTRWMDERVVASEKCWIDIEEKMPETPKRSELNELVENMTCLNALEGKIWKSKDKIVTDEKNWKTWKSDQKISMDEELLLNIVMDEELVQNIVMGGKFVKNSVMNARIDPKVVMDLSLFKIGGWNSLQPRNQKLLEEFFSREGTLFVDRNSKQRSILCDTVFGTTFCEFRSAHEEIDLTTRRSSSCDDAMLHATALC